MHLPAELPTPSNSGQILSSKQKAKAVAVKKPEDIPLSPSNSCSRSSVSSSSSSGSSLVPGLDTLSPEELKLLYKKAHIELRAKEKDIKLAAELGRSLLENNLELKARYETVRQQRRASPELIIRPSTSILTRSRDTHETASRWLQRVDSPTSDDGSTMRLISTQQAHEAIVRMLNEKNDAIQSSLDSTLADLEVARASGNDQIHKLQDEMERLQRELENAERTIERIDQQRQQESYRQRADTPISDLVDAQLKEQMNELEADNLRLQAAKAAAQNKLDQVTHSLHQWQQRIADYETIDNQCKEKQHACQYQVDEIARLTGNVEEYRSQLQRYRDNNLSCNDDEKVLLENDQVEKLRPPVLQPSMSTQTDLLSELERAWTKEHGNALSPVPSPTISSVINRRVTQQLPSINNDDADGNEEYVSLLPNDVQDVWSKELDAVHPLMSRMPSNKHYSSASSKSASTDAGSPAFDTPSTAYSSSFRPPSEKRCYAGGESLYAQLSFSGATGGRGRAFMAAAYHPRKRRLYNQQYQQQGILVLVIQKIWGWYRFSFILFLAVLINLWQGPDAILEK
ncbi:hypothetical protein BJV82DRAFT_593362 [Fennellomyces sp. T-0311]|nr:hypothetical protein BJV82DRAFT_593362 [Fennellomyces sp. T-0311]